MANEEAIFLSTVEQILLYLKKHYQSESLEELEHIVHERAKENAKDLTMQKQVELLAFVKEVWRAFSFAAEKHKNQCRESGEPYIMHPLIVALNEIYHQKHEGKIYTSTPIITALLHDTLEDTDTTYEELSKTFGKRVEQLVENLSNKPEWDQWKEEGKLSHTEKAALQFINAIKDPDSLRVKFDDRTHNLDSIKYMPPSKQVKKIVDTLQVGFIERARELKRYDFLIQLYISIQRFLTDENIDLFADDPEETKHIRDIAKNLIKDTLKNYIPHK